MKLQGCSLKQEGAQRAASSRQRTVSAPTGLSEKALGLQRRQGQGLHIQRGQQSHLAQQQQLKAAQQGFEHFAMLGGQHAHHGGVVVEQQAVRVVARQQAHEQFVEVQAR